MITTCPTLSDLPAPPPGKSGWPWDQGTPEREYKQPGALPLITIVTPSYNQAEFLEETLRSVLLQAYPNLEYIVMDGGSTDGSVDIIRKYERHLAYWTSEKDRGASHAVAKGFERATGSILAYLNSDDPYLPGAIQTAVDLFMAHPEFDVVFGDTYWTDSGGGLIAERRQTPFSRNGYLYGGADLQQPSTFWRRELYLKVGGMNPDYQTAFDTDLFVRFAVSNGKFRHIKRFLSCFRIHSEAKSSTLIEQRAKELARIRSSYLPCEFGSIKATLLRNVARVQRTFWYVIQGDLFWLLSRVPDRLTAHRSGTTVGPKVPYI
jgi:glycosyltransferase involved in cell wall biosynthesis